MSSRRQPETPAVAESTEPSVPAAGSQAATLSVARVLLYQALGVLLVLLVGGVAFYFCTRATISTPPTTQWSPASSTP